MGQFDLDKCSHTTFGRLCRHYSKLIYLLLSLRFDLFPKLSTMSIYADVPKGPAIEVFALTQAFKDDSNPNKVNLSVGGKF